MGLDMYLVLDKRRKGTDAIEKLWNSEKFWRAKMDLPEGFFDGLVLAQWRKAFGILNWFDHNLASVKEVNATVPEDEIDPDDIRNRDCVLYGRYYKVTKDELDRLLTVCKNIKLLTSDNSESEIPADIMPIGKGYFCGATNEINEWWWEDIDTTIDMLETVPKHINWEEDDAYFCIG